MAKKRTVKANQPEQIKDQSPVQNEETQEQETPQQEQQPVNMEPEKDPWYKSAPKAVWGFAKKHKKKIVAGAAIVGGVIGALFTLEKVAEAKGYSDESTDDYPEEHLSEPDDEGDSFDSAEPADSESVTE